MYYLRMHMVMTSQFFYENNCGDDASTIFYENHYGDDTSTFFSENAFQNTFPIIYMFNFHINCSITCFI